MQTATNPLKGNAASVNKKFSTQAELFRKLSQLFGTLAESNPAVSSAAIEKILVALQKAEKEIQKLNQSFEELPPIEKAREEVTAAEWRKSKRGGEYIAAELAPTLKQLLRKHAGKYTLDNHAYYLSNNERWITRYKRAPKHGGGQDG